MLCLFLVEKPLIDLKPPPSSTSESVLPSLLLSTLVRLQSAFGGPPPPPLLPAPVPSRSAHVFNARKLAHLPTIVEEMTSSSSTTSSTLARESASSIPTSPDESQGQRSDPAEVQGSDRDQGRDAEEEDDLKKQIMRVNDAFDEMFVYPSR